MTTYRVEPDGNDTPSLWRSDSEHDQHPTALAWLTARGNTVTSIDHGVVFRAAAAVLAPDVDALTIAADALFEWGIPREHCVTAAVETLAALRAYVEEAQP